MKSGLCVSGQTIRDATHRVSSLVNDIDQNVIVNLGSVDLLHGSEYVDMKIDFMNLYDAFQSRGVTPIITTLAPLANQKHNKDVEKKWKKINNFLLMTFPRVVDITPVFMAQATGHTIHDCYQRWVLLILNSFICITLNLFLNLELPSTLLGAVSHMLFGVEWVVREWWLISREKFSRSMNLLTTDRFHFKYSIRPLTYPFNYNPSVLMSFYV